MTDKPTQRVIEKAFLDRILYIGEEIPNGVFEDKRPKFVLLGVPQELINQITKELKQEWGSEKEARDDFEKWLRKEYKEEVKKMIEEKMLNIKKEDIFKLKDKAVNQENIKELVKIVCDIRQNETVNYILKKLENL